MPYPVWMAVGVPEYVVVMYERKPWIGGKLEALVRQGDVVDQWVVHPLGPRPLEAHIVARPRDAAPRQISLVVSNGNDGVLGYTLESARG